MPLPQHARKRAQPRMEGKCESLFRRLTRYGTKRGLPASASFHDSRKTTPPTLPAACNFTVALYKGALTAFSCRMLGKPRRYPLSRVHTMCVSRGAVETRVLTRKRLLSFRRFFEPRRRSRIPVS